MARIQSLVIAQGALLAVLTSTAVNADGMPDFKTHVDIDTDQDGVSDYDDYCPHSPSGAKSWTKEAVALKHGEPTWVGCSGGADTARPGYAPVARPLEPTIFEKVAVLYASGSVPTGENMTGVNLGRCFNSKKPNAPVGKAVFLQGAVILSPDGPITGSVPAFKVYFIANRAYNAFDGIDSISQLESVLGESLEPNATLSPAHLEDQALVANFGTDVKNSARINGDYVVIKHVETAPPGLHYCYFFDKIMNP